MEIHVNEDSKLVEFWLTREEKQNAELRQKLKPIYQKLKLQKYFVAVFESGERDLADAASDLLCCNRKRMAQLEVERERRNGLAMNQ